MEVQSRCPFNFECEDCLYNKKAYCSYIAEEEQVNLQEIADKIEKQDYEQTMKDAEALIKANEEREKTESEAFWSWWGRTSPVDPQCMQKPVILPMPGGFQPGGGSSSRRRKQPSKKAPEYLKTWGL